MRTTAWFQTWRRCEVRSNSEFRTEADDLVIGDGIEFCRFTDEEFVSLAETGALTPQFFASQHIEAGTCFGVRAKVPLKHTKTMAGQSEGVPITEDTLKHRFGQRNYWTTAELMEDIYFVLRLSSPDLLQRGGMLFQMKDLHGTSNSCSGPPKRLVPIAWPLDDRTLLTARTVWAHLASRATSKRRLPDICTRRFAMAFDRGRVDDQLIDMMIVAEALFLSDQSTDRSELGYRMRLRAAKLLQKHDGTDPGGTAKLFSEVYSLRSTIVHGGPLPINSSRKCPAPEAITVFTNVMRRCLQIAIEQYSTTTEFATSEFWDGLVFG
jgi:Apea-like HEPN